MTIARVEPSANANGLEHLGSRRSALVTAVAGSPLVALPRGVMAAEGIPR
jgi:hypothetical protein